MLVKSKCTMLIIDDDVAILKSFKRILERNGYEVATAQTGREAKAKLEKHGYDATLVDLKLPDMNGVDLLPRMEEKDPQMVKIVITGASKSDDDCQTAKRTADIFLAKPVQPETLLNALKIKLKERNVKNV